MILNWKKGKSIGIFFFFSFSYFEVILLFGLSDVLVVGCDLCYWALISISFYANVSIIHLSSYIKFVYGR